jgi:hypothetical protein
MTPRKLWSRVIDPLGNDLRGVIDYADNDFNISLTAYLNFTGNYKFDHGNSFFKTIIEYIGEIETIFEIVNLSPRPGCLKKKP